MEKRREKRKNAMIRARTTARLKTQAERIFDQLGMTASEAINLFYKQVILRKGLPFAVEIPNELTRETFAKTDRGDESKKQIRIDSDRSISHTSPRPPTNPPAPLKNPSTPSSSRKT